MDKGQGREILTLPWEPEKPLQEVLFEIDK